ncbi:unnamed protein product [Danaus chrysippus]|nr:unnamed protein product [Danaus chrysippus]
MKDNTKMLETWSRQGSEMRTCALIDQVEITGDVIATADRGRLGERRENIPPWKLTSAITLLIYNQTRIDIEVLAMPYIVT